MNRFIFIFYLLVSSFGFTQTLDIVKGDEYSKSKNEAFNGFVGENENHIFSINYIYTSKKKKALIIRKFSKDDLSLRQEGDIYKKPTDGYYSEPFEALIANDKIYLFSILTHNKEKTTTLGLYVFNDSLEMESFEIIDSIANLARTNINIELSKSKDAIMVTKNHTHRLVEREVINLICLGLDAKPIWTKELMSVNNIHKLNVEKLLFIDQNEIYLLCNYGFKVDESADVDDIKLLSNKYTIWVYNRHKNFLKEIELKLKLKWINGMDLRRKANGNIVVAGFVNSSRTFAINAYFNIELDNQYAIIQNNYFKIKKNEMALFLPKGSNLKKLENFYFRKLLVQSDGSFYMVAEHYYKYVDRVYDPRTNTTSSIDHYNYEHILVSYFDSTGNFMWTKRIPKIQNSTNDFGYYSSIVSFNTENGIYLFYNDHNKNINVPIDDIDKLKTLFNGQKSVLTYVKVNASGELDRKQIETTNGRFLLNAKRSAQINASEIYLLMELGRKAKVIGLNIH